MFAKLDSPNTTTSTQHQPRLNNIFDNSHWDVYIKAVSLQTASKSVNCYRRRPSSYNSLHFSQTLHLSHAKMSVNLVIQHLYSTIDPQQVAAMAHNANQASAGKPLTELVAHGKEKKNRVATAPNTIKATRPLNSWIAFRSMPSWTPLCNFR